MFEKNKVNYFYLGIAISYFVLSVIQVRNTELLPMSLYSSVAWASLILSVCELIKSCFQMKNDNLEKGITFMTRGLNMINNRILVISKFKELEKEVKEAEKEREELKSYIEELEKTKKNSRANKINNFFTFMEILSVSIIILISPIKNVPNDLYNNKVICILSLFSFSFLMFSFFLKSNNDDPFQKFDEYIEKFEEIEDEHLNDLKRISEVRQDDNNRKTL